jgi:hypothetical protein
MMSSTPPGSFPAYDPESDRSAEPGIAAGHGQPQAPPAYQPEPAEQPQPQPYQPQSNQPQPYQPQSFQPPPYVEAGREHIDDQGQTQHGGPARHSAPPSDQTPWSAPAMPAYGGGDTPAAPLPYGGVPGLVLPPNYSVYLTQTRRAVGVVGLILALIGVAVVIASFTALDWLSGDDVLGGTASVDFKDLHDIVGSDSPTLQRLYFSWLGWALLAAVAVFALLGNLPTRSHPLWRVLGALTGVAGAVVTFFAVYTDGTTLRELIVHASDGFWLALAGFLVAALGAVIGPRRRRI